jgi:hypothetical protein
VAAAADVGTIADLADMGRGPFCGLAAVIHQLHYQTPAAAALAVAEAHGGDALTRDGALGALPNPPSAARSLLKPGQYWHWVGPEKAAQLHRHWTTHQPTELQDLESAIGAAWDEVS